MDSLQAAGYVEIITSKFQGARLSQIIAIYLKVLWIQMYYEIRGGFVRFSRFMKTLFRCRNTSYCIYITVPPPHECYL
jgi:hypothetical protein